MTVRKNTFLISKNHKPLARDLAIFIFKKQKIRAFRQMSDLQNAFLARFDF